MQRWIERNVQLYKRGLTPRYIKVIFTVFGAFLIINLFLYLLGNLIFSSWTTTTTTEPTTIPTTTTTTTIETSTEQSFQLGCFFDKTNVTLADGSIRPLHLLTTTDQVLVRSTSGKIQKSRVLTIFHHKHSSVRFFEIYTRNKLEPLRLTPSHSVLTKKNDEKHAFPHYRFAYDINIGDFVFTSELKPLQVINIKEIILSDQIISTPLTFEGSIIVNDLIASCYATYSHTFMHALALPLRYWYQIEMFAQFNYFIVYLIEFYAKISLY